MATRVICDPSTDNVTVIISNERGPEGPPGTGGGGDWGEITGTITDQTDLVEYIGERLASGEATAKNVEVFVRNVTGATITKGSIVYINGASGQRPTITKAQANNDANSAQTIGFVKADIANNGTGYVITSGDLENVDTFGLGAGVQLYLSPDTAGLWTTIKPSAPNHLVYVGIVVSAHPTQGIIYVSIQNGYELEELHNVAITSPSTGQVLRYNATTGLWSNQTLPTSTGGNGTADAGKFVVFGEAGELRANSEDAEAIFADSTTGTGVFAASVTGTAVRGLSNGSGTGGSFESVTGTGLSAVSQEGEYIAEFNGPNGAFVATSNNAFGWWRRNAANSADFTGRIQAASTLEANRTYTLPDATGDVLLDSTLAATLTANAATMRTALGGGVAGQAVFQAETVEAVNAALNTIYAAKTSPTIKRLDSTIAADPDLRILLTPGIWLIELTTSSNSNSSAGWRCRISGPSSRMTGGSVLGQISVCPSFGLDLRLASSTNTNITNNSDGRGGAVQGRIIWATSSSGEVSFDWAQNTSHDSDSIIYSGFIKATRIGD